MASAASSRPAMNPDRQRTLPAEPPGPYSLDKTSSSDKTTCPRTITRRFLEDCDGHAEEYTRYLKTRFRGIHGWDGPSRIPTENKNVLVTGASGCIGSALVGLLADHAPRCLVGVGLGATRDHLDEYHEMDVRNRDEIRGLFRRTKPDVVFHLAAQRHPGLAERNVFDTVSTNVTGTRNVLDAAIECGAEKFVFASTGKAVRPHTLDVYAASKKVSEWMVAQNAAAGAIECAVARFTHVVDNGIVLERLRRWTENDEPFRLHSPESPFYIQSALESAQLLLCSLQGCGAPDLPMFAINDLGWPVTALDLAVGVLKEARKEARLEILGPQPGYEQGIYPGLYDPACCGEVSPLFNFAESFGADPLEHAPAVDRVRLAFDRSCAVDDGVQDLLWRRHERNIRQRLDAVLWDMLQARLLFVPTGVLTRIARVTRAHRAGMSAHHALIDDSVRGELARRGEPDG
jgi:nucleoside-diphosphate-sugar epimerase